MFKIVIFKKKKEKEAKRKKNIYILFSILELVTYVVNSETWVIILKHMLYSICIIYILYEQLSPFFTVVPRTKHFTYITH